MRASIFEPITVPIMPPAQTAKTNDNSIKAPPSNEWTVNPMPESIVTATNDVPTATFGLTPTKIKKGVINIPPPNAISLFNSPVSKPNATARCCEKIF